MNNPFHRGTLSSDPVNVSALAPLPPGKAQPSIADHTEDDVAENQLSRCPVCRLNPFQRLQLQSRPPVQKTTWVMQQKRWVPSERRGKKGWWAGLPWNQVAGQSSISSLQLEHTGVRHPHRDLELGEEEALLGKNSRVEKLREERYR